jgi:outer membrane immunogenic protein
MVKLLLASAALVALTIGPAMSADMPLKAPVVAPPPAFSWTGCYFGVAGGYAWGTSRAENDGTDGAIPITGNYQVRGGIFGGTSGCNLLQAGPWVLGVEGDLSWSGKRGSGNDLPPYNVTTVNQTNEKWLNTDRVRVGYAANGWLVYATAGAAVASVAYSITGAGIIGGTVTETHTRTGWTAGAGVEWAFSGSWSVKAEYLFVDFGGVPYFNFNGLIPVLPGAGAVANRNGGVFLNDNIVRVGINYRFGGAAAVATKY